MKNLLFISPDTFGYYKVISEAIARKGFNPIWLNQLPDTSVLSRVFFRLTPNIARHIAIPFFLRELEKIDRVDHILIIKGEGVSEAVIAQMRARFPEAKIVFYLWDSLANVSGADRKIGLCDAAYSFDPVDCDKTEALEHLPLFHSKNVRPATYKPGFAAFIGTLHSNRYQLIRELADEIAKVTRIAPFLYFYYPNRMLFSLLKLMKTSFRKVRQSEVHFEPLDRDQFATINSEAEIVIDICHPKQSGLTMRSIEALGDGKKLITNNRTVRRYDFFRPENCYVIDGELGADFGAFLNSPYHPPQDEVVAKYHIDAWLQALLLDDIARETDGRAR
ncbi:hypothetical protein [Celeribacter sp.]|uniref:hypothetical protein n=1 Tax=Celeribacter sp. TaxID=1890673 RepID=UPI003A93813A